MSRRTWVIAILTAVGTAMAIRFGMAFPWADTLDALGDADPLLLAGAGLANMVSLAAKGTVWYLLLRRIGAARHRTAQSATFVGAAVNSITVAGAGEAVRAQLVHDKDGIPYSQALASLLATRVAEALALAIFLAVSLALIRPWPGAVMTALTLLGLVAMALVGSRVVPSRRWYPSIAGLAPTGVLGWTAPVLVATVNWGAQWFAYHWSIEATHLAITPAVSLTALVASNVAGILRLTPGNIGVVQGSVILGLRAFKIPVAQGLAAGLALQAVQVLPVLALAMGLVGARGFRQLATHRARTA